MGRQFDEYIEIAPEEKIELDSIRKEVRKFLERLDDVKNYKELKQLATEVKRFREKVETADEKIKKIVMWQVMDADMVIGGTENSLSTVASILKKDIELEDIKWQIECHKKMMDEEYDGLHYTNFIEKVVERKNKKKT